MSKTFVQGFTSMTSHIEKHILMNVLYNSDSCHIKPNTAGGCPQPLHSPNFIAGIQRRLFTTLKK